MGALDRFLPHERLPCETEGIVQKRIVCGLCWQTDDSTGDFSRINNLSKGHIN